MQTLIKNQSTDLGIALVELLSYIGDSLSDYQDLVANEAYLSTARNRISRRHAKLLDYLFHEVYDGRTRITVTLLFGLWLAGTTIPLTIVLLFLSIVWMRNSLIGGFDIKVKEKEKVTLAHGSHYFNLCGYFGDAQVI